MAAQGDPAAPGRRDAPNAAKPGRAARVMATLALFTAAGTYVAAQVDFVRRHRPGLHPLKYWLPQVTNIWLPGLGTAAFFVLLAIVLHRRPRAK